MYSTDRKSTLTPRAQRNAGRLADRAKGLAIAAVLLTCTASAQDQPRHAVQRVPPVYPPMARQMRITGVVVVTATVDASGKVVKAESSSGNKLLAPSAIDAVRQWKFSPGEGTATVTVDVNFEI
jgi:TonB family protein